MLTRSGTITAVWLALGLAAGAHADLDESEERDRIARTDDLPYFVQVGDKRHLVLPYAFDTNDMQFFHTNRFSGAADFAAYAIDAFDWLHREGAHAPKMMSIGLHLRMIGRPGRIGALDRILRHITNRGDAWIARRVDIASTPSTLGLGNGSTPTPMSRPLHWPGITTTPWGSRG
jgi:peptidoglycan/xylan/chitin deacetylase (PgdA/CDA1 family)